MTGTVFAGADGPTVLLQSPRTFVGVDAHIDPANGTDHAEIYGKFAIALGGDVGISPRQNHKEAPADGGRSFYIARTSI